MKYHSPASSPCWLELTLAPHHVPVSFSPCHPQRPLGHLAIQSCGSSPTHQVPSDPSCPLPGMRLNVLGMTYPMPRFPKEEMVTSRPQSRRPQRCQAVQATFLRVVLLVLSAPSKVRARGPWNSRSPVRLTEARRLGLRWDRRTGAAKLQAYPEDCCQVCPWCSHCHGGSAMGTQE